MLTILTTGFSKPFGTNKPIRPMSTDVRLAKTRQKSKLLQGSLRPNLSIQAEYRDRLQKLIKEMNKSVLYWLGARFKATEDQRQLLMAYDATAAEELQAAIKSLRDRWLKRFEKAAEELAQFFAKKVVNRSDADLKKILKKSGIAIEFQITKPMREAVDAIVHENVSLIKSIPEKYLQQVEGSTMRSVLAGRDLKTLYDDIRSHYNVTDRRAALIARDQNNKATSALQKVRFQEIGIEKAVWRHSHAGRDPRKSHVANDGKEYDVAKGWYDPEVKEHIRPGYLINCRCFCTPILP